MPATLPNPMSIESALAAHFKQADCPSVPGVSWLVRTGHGEQACL